MSYCPVSSMQREREGRRGRKYQYIGTFSHKSLGVSAACVDRLKGFFFPFSPTNQRCAPAHADVRAE